MPGMQTAAGDMRRKSSLPTPEQCLLSPTPGCPHAALGSLCPVPHSPGHVAGGHFLSSLQVSFPCSSWVMSSGLENGIPAHREREQGGCRLQTQGPTQKARWLLQADPKMPSRLYGVLRDARLTQ